MARPIRYTRQIEPGRWVSRCKVCPRRSGRRQFQTEQAADDWWASHVESRLHQQFASRETARTPEQVLLDNIFGKETSGPEVAPNERKGHILSRSDNVRYKDDDNPRGREAPGGET